MNYESTLKFLYKQLPIYQRIGKAAYKNDLSNTLALDEFYGHPHRQFKIIHIAGTNGKGSVSHMLSAVLQKAGYKTGLYTSPHLKDFRERIKINGKPVTKAFVTTFVEKSQIIIRKIHPSFFELTVLMAFDYFAAEKVDIAVIETGMGGRLDSTNVVTPLLSVITNIAYDHTTFLGTTLPEIAGEKAGIIKKEIPVVIGEKHSETELVFNKKAKENNSRLYFSEDCHQIDYRFEHFNNKSVFNVKQNGETVYPQLDLDLLGNYQQKNLLTVLCALKVLKEENILSVDKDDIYGGLGNIVKLTGLQGRWQVLQYNPMIILDIAHNENGLRAVFSQIKNIPYKKLHLVIGFVNDKEVDDILCLFPDEAIYYFTQANIPRALPVTALKTKANDVGFKGKIFNHVKDAFESAKRNAGDFDIVLVTGSAFVVAEVL